jgi:hypothetical protein
MTVLESPEHKATLTLLQKKAAETGNRLIVDLYLQLIEKMGDMEMHADLLDLEDPAARTKAFATPDGDDYFNLEVKPPAELFRFLSEGNAGELTKEEVVAIDLQVTDWCTKRYAPPAHLGFYIDFSDPLAASGAHAPLELWLTRRKWCGGY